MIKFFFIFFIIIITIYSTLIIIKYFDTEKKNILEKKISNLNNNLTKYDNIINNLDNQNKQLIKIINKNDPIIKKYKQKKEEYFNIKKNIYKKNINLIRPFDQRII